MNSSDPRATSASDPQAQARSPIKTDELVALVYDELHALARRLLARERRTHTWQTTDLVHELYLRLARQRQDGWDSRAYFFAAAAEVIRRILVNHEESRRTQKRGGHQAVLALDAEIPVAADPPPALIDVIALDELLDELARLDPRQSRIVELKFFGGLSIREIATILDVSPRTVDGEWALARGWLRSRLDRRGGP